MTNYINLGKSFETPIEDYIIDHWIEPEDINFFSKHINSRIVHIPLIPTSFFVRIFDVVIGALSGILTVFSGGYNYKFSMDHLDSSRKIVANPFKHLLNFFNPTALLDPKQYNYASQNNSPPSVAMAGDGLLTEYVIDYFNGCIFSCINSESILKQHLASRCLAAVLLVTSIVTRILDFIAGATAAVFSLVTLGSIESLNNIAYRGLQAPGIIKDIYYCAVKIINPWAGTQHYREINVYTPIHFGENQCH